MIAHFLSFAHRLGIQAIALNASSRQWRRFPPGWFLATVLLFALGLRIAAAGGSLWLDEIWSLELAQQAPSSLAVLGIRTDNNHVLNTLCLRAIGPNWAAFVYRVPGVILGMGSVLLGGWIAARWGRLESVTASTLLASSYLLVHYSSEARGYSLALFCALGAWELSLRYLESPRQLWGFSICFWGTCVVGLLAHPIFVHFLLAIVAWSVTVISSRTDSWRDTLRQGATLLFVPVMMASVGYLAVWRHLDLGGGPPYSLAQVLLQTASLSIGGPVTGWCALIAAVLLAIGCSTAFWRLQTDSLHIGLFLGLALTIPVVHALVVRPPFLFPRYFLMAVVSVPFVLSFALAAVYRQRDWGRWRYSALLLLFIGANLWQTIQLATLGRGQYLAALNYLAATTSDPTLTISSDHNFGVRKLIEYYAKDMSPRPPVQYFDGNRWPPNGPRWLILHRYAESTAPLPPERQLIDGHTFRLDRMFDCSILSGWQWWCYRRVEG